MKKVLVLLLALAAVAGVFAQTPALTFGMYSEYYATIAKVDSYDIYNETYLNYKAKDMGFSATVVAKSDFFATPRNYKVWYQVCSAAKLSAGVLRETGSARLTSYVDGNGFSTRMANVQAGVMADMVIVKNMLTLAAFMPLTGVAPLDDAKNGALGVSFSLPNVATIVAAYRAVNQEFSAGVDLKAIKDVTVRAGIANYNLAVAPAAKLVLYATLGKKAGDLNLGVDANFVMQPTAKVGIKGLVEYALGTYTLGAEVSYDNSNLAAGGATDMWYKAGGLVVNPYLKKAFAAGSIVVGGMYNATTAALSLPITFIL